MGEVDVCDMAFAWDGEESISVKNDISIFDGDTKVGGFKALKTDPIKISFKIPDGRYQIYHTYDSV